MDNKWISNRRKQELESLTAAFSTSETVEELHHRLVDFSKREDHPQEIQDQLAKMETAYGNAVNPDQKSPLVSPFALLVDQQQERGSNYCSYQLPRTTSAPNQTTVQQTDERRGTPPRTIGTA